MTHRFPKLINNNRIWLVLYYIVNVFHFQFLLKYFLGRQLNILGLNNLIGKNFGCLLDPPNIFVLLFVLQSTKCLRV